MQEKPIKRFIENGGLVTGHIHLLGNYLPSGYSNLNASERVLAQRHPVQAVKVYNTGNIATDKTIKVYGRNGWQDNSDAFRHCLWNALMKNL